MENHYNTLGIAPNATEDEIKKIYRSLAMRFHPDRNPAPGAEARFKSITKAYEILSDPVKREEYNQSVNHRIIIDAEAEAYHLWRSVFNLHGTVLPPACTRPNIFSQHQKTKASNEKSTPRVRLSIA